MNEETFDPKETAFEKSISFVSRKRYLSPLLKKTILSIELCIFGLKCTP
ncbi:hypothetical protein P3G55_10675 [Leptospira sp. 96542]|nr:hypothetical protein [Leptospira sp. 96542]